MKKYLVVPGKVRSQDGDVHTVSAEQLMSLYGVRPQECVVVHPDRDQWRAPHQLIELYPRSNGDYTLPRSEEN